MTNCTCKTDPSITCCIHPTKAKQELKPCPKCGPDNLIRELSINDRVWVKCTSCTMRGWEEDWFHSPRS